MVNSKWGYVYLRTDADRLWFDEGMRRGFRIHRPARAFWRWWGVRHLRCGLYAAYWAACDVATTDYEEWLHTARWKGWA